MTAIPAEIGAEVRFSKTLGETDFYLFSGISGDFDKVHVNEEYMKTTVFGRRIAHGLLVLSLSSNTASMMSSRYGCSRTPSRRGTRSPSWNSRSAGLPRCWGRC